MDKYRKGQVNTMFWDDDNNQDYDYDKLRKNLVNDFGAMGATFLGGLGFVNMMEAEDASNEELLKMAKREGYNLNRYKK